MFTSERDALFTTAGFARMIDGRVAKLSLEVHSHMLRHACGYVLANRATTAGRCKLTYATRTFSTRFRIRSCHRQDLRTSPPDEAPLPSPRLPLAWVASEPK